nr:sporulation-specific diadenylate cyclase CdaS [Scopulibacillus darangshiensis]
MGFIDEMKHEISHITDALDHKQCCILKEFEQIQGIFGNFQSTAASYYLKFYLAPYTDCYPTLSTALQHMSERNHGALIVIQRDDLLDDLIQPGTRVGATLTFPLLESIFYPGGPLHDGAVIIQENMIVSAGNVLPLTHSIVGDRKLGTRHRAALGLSELSDALILVVSEETGRTSFALGGKLFPISPTGFLQ